MRYILLALCAGMIAFSGCAQKEKEPDPVLPVQKKKKNNLNEKYNDYLLLMNEDQRARFFKLDTDLKRDRFLQAEGIKFKKFLNDRLQPGMEISKAREVIGRPPATSDINNDEIGKKTLLIYEQFNGYNNMKYALSFENDKLKSWRLWLY